MTAPAKHDTILIAGGGIGGLACAIALSQTGWKAVVLERAEAFEEAGAGIQLGPNATRLLSRWGVWQGLEAARVLPQRLLIHDGLSGNLLAQVPLGQAMGRYGAPYAALHRADLQAALLDKAKRSKAIRIQTGFEVTGFEETKNGITVKSGNGKQASGAGLIGADGLRSTIRAQLDIGVEPQPSGHTAWRALLPANAAPMGFGPADIGLWLGPGAHMVHYAVKGGAKVNLVAVVEGDLADQGWNAPGEPQDLLPRFMVWSAAPRSLLEAATAWRRWALASAKPLGRWGDGRVTLLGDAAHPILPFLAQGGAMAIEDAAMLAQAIARGGRARRRVRPLLR